MVSISNIAINNCSMNGIIVLSDGYATIENGNITTNGDIITANITKNNINLNLANGRSLSLFPNLEDKATYTGILCLSGIIYNYDNISNNNINNIINEMKTIYIIIITKQ